MLPKQIALELQQPCRRSTWRIRGCPAGVDWLKNPGRHSASPAVGPPDVRKGEPLGQSRSIVLEVRDQYRKRCDTTAPAGPGPGFGRGRAPALLCSLALLILLCGDQNASAQQPPLIGQGDLAGLVSQPDQRQTRTGPTYGLFRNPFQQSSSSACCEATAVTSNRFYAAPVARDEPRQCQAQPPGADPLAQGRPVSWSLLVPNTLHDELRIWTFPAQVVRGKHWKPALAFVAATAGLVALDPSEAPYFRTTTSFHGFNQVFSSGHTGIGMAAVPATFYVAALLRHNAYDQHTSLLAGEAVLDSEILAAVMKSTIRRLRPSEVPQGAGFTDTFTDGKGGFFSGQGSFPSGHTIAAFSIATIFANRYSRHRWVPWVAYGLAATVAFSRVTLQAHFTSDVFAGAVLGYTISRYVALQP